MQPILADEEFTLRPTIAEVSFGALRHNFEGVRQLAGEAKILATVKANAYGHGLIPVARKFLEFGAYGLGVAFLEEGIALRRAGIEAPILVLGGIIGNQISHFLHWNLMITASSVFKLEQIEETAAFLNKRAKVHLKIDTGMERIGVHHYNADKFFDAAQKCRHCDIEGVFSHFAASHSADGTFTKLQLERFLEALEYFPRHDLPMPQRHIANSGAILQHPDTIFDMVRPGIMLYGVYPDKECRKTVPLLPVLTLKSRIVYFKVVPAGVPVGYDGSFVAPEQTRVVTIPVGYGDGYRRGLSNKGQVLIHGKRYPVIGRVSMDQTMVNIGWDSAYNDDEVVLIGAQENDCITCEELAELLDTSPYEILTAINTRVPRLYKDGK
jgi:alanine racemase